MRIFNNCSVLLMCLFLAACGGSSGGSNSNDNSGGKNNNDNLVEGISLSERQGIPTSQNTNKKLFYTTHTVSSGVPSADASLHVAKAQQDSDKDSPPSTSLVEDDLSIGSLYELFGILPIHTATVESDKSSTSDFNIDNIVYLSAKPTSSSNYNPNEESLVRVSVDYNDSNTPTKISAETASELSLASRRILQFDLTDSTNTRLAYATDSSQKSGFSYHSDWKALSFSDDTSTDPVTFDDSYEVVGTLTNNDNQPNGWLVIDHNDGKLLQVNLAGVSPQPVLDKQGDPIEGLKGITPLTGEFLNGSQYFVFIFDETAEDKFGELWHFQQSAQSIAKPIKHVDDNAKLYFSSTISGDSLQAATPADEQVTQIGDDLYFFKAPIALFGPSELYKANATDGWKKLISTDDEMDGGSLTTADNQLVWSDGESVNTLDADTEEIKELDGQKRYNEGLTIPKVATKNVDLIALGSRDGWIYYNRTLIDSSEDISNPVETTYAVAVKVGDPRSEINISDANWVGASSTGHINNKFQSNNTELSEVFLLQNDGTVGAVEATDPEAGMVKLGNIGSTDFDDLTMYGPVPGPHRLMKIQDGDNSQVIYVNTTRKNSLVYLTDEDKTSTFVDGF